MVTSVVGEADLKSPWLPDMPLPVGTWTQLVIEADLSWEEQGKLIRLFLNAWTRGSPGDRSAIVSDRVWDVFLRMVPEILATRKEHERLHVMRSTLGKAGNSVRWGKKKGSPGESPGESLSLSLGESLGDRTSSSSFLCSVEDNQPIAGRIAERSKATEQQFEELFWPKYPMRRGVRTGKKTAKASWLRHVFADEVPALLDALERAKQHPDWRKERGQFVPHATTWLNGHRWKDDTGPSSTESYEGWK